MNTKEKERKREEKIYSREGIHSEHLVYIISLYIITCGERSTV